MHIALLITAVPQPGDTRFVLACLHDTLAQCRADLAELYARPPRWCSLRYIGPPGQARSRVSVVVAR